MNQLCLPWAQGGHEEPPWLQSPRMPSLATSSPTLEPGDDAVQWAGLRVRLTSRRNADVKHEPGSGGAKPGTQTSHCLCGPVRGPDGRVLLAAIYTLV